MQAREEQKFRKAAEEQALQAAEEQARKAAEQARKAAEEQARKVAEEQARKAIEEQGKAAEEQARKAAEEQARKAREEQARKAAEEQARDAAEEQARKAREEQTTKVAEEQARKAAEEKTRKDLQDWVAADKAIADAARDGGAPVGLGRLNLVWQGRAGKTALARSLAGEAWEATASTVGAEQRLLQVTPAALNVPAAAAEPWRRAEGCDATGAVSAAEAAAQLAARKLAVAHGASGVAVGVWGKDGREMAELLEQMDGPLNLADARALLPPPPSPEHCESGSEAALAERLPVPAPSASAPARASATGATSPAAANHDGCDNVVVVGAVNGEVQCREAAAAVVSMDREVVLRMAAGGKAGGLRLSLWDFGGKEVRARRASCPTAQA